MRELRVVRALWGSSHPGPTLVVTVLSVALGIAAGLEPWRLVVLGIAVAAGQLSVGISNDAIDVTRDRAVGRTDKPLARGDITVRTAWIAACAAVVLALVLSAVLGAGMLVAHAAALASAWSYNAWLKATPASVAPFIVSFGIFPSLATLSAAAPALAAPWATAAGAALGIAVHLTNVLPDLDDDRETGVRGLPHRIGARWAAIIASASIVLGALAVLLGSTWSRGGTIPVLSWILFDVVCAVAVVTAVRALSAPPSRGLFRLAMLAALLLAIQLMTTPGALLG